MIAPGFISVLKLPTITQGEKQQKAYRIVSHIETSLLFKCPYNNTMHHPYKAFFLQSTQMKSY